LAWDTLINPVVLYFSLCCILLHCSLLIVAFACLLFCKSAYGSRVDSVVLQAMVFGTTKSQKMKGRLRQKNYKRKAQIMLKISFVVEGTVFAVIRLDAPFLEQSSVPSCLR
jgi:NhaP-type Na+/H+ or K+/H+ antiporter